MERSETISSAYGMSVRQAALITGLAYLFNPVSFAEFYAMPRLFVADATQTATNLAAHPRLFATATMCYFFSMLGDVVIAWALYVLLAPVNRALAMLGSLLQLVYAAAWLAAISNLGVLYRLVAIPDYSQHILPAELPSLGVQLYGAFQSGWGLALIVFALHLVVTGWLIARSTYLPRWLGWLLILDGVAWVVDRLGVYFYPDTRLGFLGPFFAFELVFMVWLLGWGWRVPEPA